MFDFNKYISFIDGVLSAITLSDKKRKEFTDMRNKVVERYNDPNLYLSMLSDFSSGKSTIINKLIGKKLLKTANLATTSVPTYIKNCSGDKTEITVETVDGISYDLSKASQLQSFEKLIGMELPKEEQRIVSALTTDEVFNKLKNDAIFRLVDKVTVKVPYESGVDNLCIIDTPGVNPGSENTSQHSERTKKILSDTADSLIILFPATQNYTAGFQEFLEENAREFLDDAIFVVTLMDLIEDEEERKEVIEDTRNRLQSHFKLKNPNILYCAAQKAGKDEYWTEQFEEFKSTLYSHLREHREQAVNRTLGDLLRKLLEEINIEINSDNADLQNKLKILAENSVPNLTGVLDETTRKGKKKITEASESYKSNLKKTGEKLPDNIKSRIRSSLNSYTKRSDITNYTKNRLSDEVVDECKVLERDVQKYQKELNQSHNEIRKEMVQTMISYYGRISELNNETSSVNIASSVSETSSELASGLSGINVELSGAIEIAAAAGGVAIAAAVFAALGPVGWIAGGILGLFGADYLFVGSARDKVTDAVFPKIPSIVSGAMKEAQGALNSYITKIVDETENYKKELLRQYTDIYQKLKSAFDEQQKQLLSKIQNNMFLIKNTNLLLAEIEQMKKSGG